MMKNKNYSILVNTTDSFEDCWIPFFTLFKKYWPAYNGNVYLNTETKLFGFPGLKIISVQNNINTPNEKTTWSECLINALESIDDEIILYMQEDYFIKDMVKNDTVIKYAQLMKSNSEIDCIHLTDQSIKPGKKSETYEGLYIVYPKQRYFISCQAALWRKDTLLKYLRPYESAWEFEEFGSKRGAIIKSNFFVVDKDWVKLDKFEIIPYIFTGIIQGRWYEPIVKLFEKHELQIDYTKRGFVKDALPKSLLLKLKHRWNKIPVILRHKFEMMKLKRSN